MSLDDFIKKETGKEMATSGNNRETRLVQLKAKPQGRDELFPTFTSDGKDTLMPDRSVFAYQHHRTGQLKVNENHVDFFKEISKEDYFIAEIYVAENGQIFITRFYDTSRTPSDVRDFLVYLREEKKADNFGLLTEKAALYRNDRFWYMNSERNGLNYPFRPESYKQVTSALIARLDAQLESHRQQGYAHAEAIELKVADRMVVGLGEESVYETGMTLHPVYGMPYIPGSAVKGILRNFIINELFRDSKDKASEKLALKDYVFCQIFGCPEESIWKKALRGRVIFFDALPKGNITIKADVMTPHYGDYYMDESGNTPPADWLEPVPITFLTVEKTVFSFAFAVRDDLPKQPKRRKNKETGEWYNVETHDAFKDQTFSQIVGFWLPKALKEHGIGAKTAIGYGLFKSHTGQ